VVICNKQTNNRTIYPTYSELTATQLADLDDDECPAEAPKANSIKRPLEISSEEIKSLQDLESFGKYHTMRVEVVRMFDIETVPTGKKRGINVVDYSPNLRKDTICRGQRQHEFKMYFWDWIEQTSALREGNILLVSRMQINVFNGRKVGDVGDQEFRIIDQAVKSDRQFLDSLRQGESVVGYSLKRRLRITN
jgi:hypothetical protein